MPWSNSRPTVPVDHKSFILIEPTKSSQESPRFATEPVQDVETLPTSSNTQTFYSPSQIQVLPSNPTDTPSTTHDASVPGLSTGQTDNRRGDYSVEEPTFLSFEEWKERRLEEVGQSPDMARGGKLEIQEQDRRRRSSGISIAHDTLGDEAEIELNFGSFGNVDAVSEALPPRKATDERREQNARDEAREEKKLKNTDAGKTSRDRFNYASFDCAATIRKTNPECKTGNAILSENKDSYLLNQCSAKNKFIIIELCDHILIDTIALANFEFFSSTFRTIRASVSDKYPVRAEKWKDLGTFEASNRRGAIQPFAVENGLIYARYLRIEFLTHYGQEHYCPVTMIRVHGNTMLDTTRKENRQQEGEDDREDEAEMENAEIAVPQPLAEASKPPSSAPSSDATPEPTSTVASALPVASNQTGQETDLGAHSELPSETVKTASRTEVSQATPTSRLIIDTRARLGCKTCPANTEIEETQLGSHSRQSIHEDESAVKYGNESGPNASMLATVSQLSIVSNATSPQNETGTATTSIRPGKPTSTKARTSNTPTPSPATEESIFSSLRKRLQNLESQSNFSHQYIEDLSHSLRRQQMQTKTSLESLNHTLQTTMAHCQAQYDQLWQSTVLELSSQKEQGRREVIELGRRVGLLVEELLWQKRIVAAQFAVLIVCLGLLVFSRFAAPGMAGTAAQESMLLGRTSPSREASYLEGLGWDRLLPLQGVSGSSRPGTSGQERQGRTQDLVIDRSTTTSARSAETRRRGSADMTTTGRSPGVREKLSPHTQTAQSQSSHHHQHHPAWTTNRSQYDGRLTKSETHQRIDSLQLDSPPSSPSMPGSRYSFSERSPPRARTGEAEEVTEAGTGMDDEIDEEADQSLGSSRIETSTARRETGVGSSSLQSPTPPPDVDGDGFAESEAAVARSEEGRLRWIDAAPDRDLEDRPDSSDDPKADVKMRRAISSPTLGGQSTLLSVAAGDEEDDVDAEVEAGADQRPAERGPLEAAANEAHEPGTEG